ncbi:putative protein-serine/threonine phosphatase [Helianthus anomalus]
MGLVWLISGYFGSLFLVGLCKGINGITTFFLGRGVKATSEVIAIQLSVEHNASIESIRQELHRLHLDDPLILVLKHNVWRVKGLIQISRSIGYVYMKKAEFNREPLYAKFRLRDPIRWPILSSDPSISAHEIQPHDQFLIFASDGLWEHLSNQEAVDIGSAKRLVKATLQEVAKKREMRYSDLKKIERGVRRHFHDDITVDSNLVSKASIKGPTVSITGGVIYLSAKTLMPLAATVGALNVC